MRGHDEICSQFQRANHSPSNRSAKVSQLSCFESFPLCARQRNPPTVTVRVPSLRRFFFHFSHTSNFSPGLPTATCSFIVAVTHFVGRPCWRPFISGFRLTINRIYGRTGSKFGGTFSICSWIAHDKLREGG